MLRWFSIGCSPKSVAQLYPMEIGWWGEGQRETGVGPQRSATPVDLAFGREINPPPQCRGDAVLRARIPKGGTRSQGCVIRPLVPGQLSWPGRRLYTRPG